MPLNGTTYLTRHGWAGKGVPLDGESGRGLKKPIALPMKRNVKGLGKERDRATEWWDCVFEAGAKKMKDGNVDNTAEAKAHTNGAGTSSSATARVTGKANSLSLVSIAKRQHARKMLMNGFIRGRETDYEKQQREMASLIVSKIDATKDDVEKLDREAKKREKRKRKEADGQAKVLDDEAQRKKRKRESQENGSVAVQSEVEAVKGGESKEQKRQRRKDRKAEREVKKTKKMEKVEEAVNGKRDSGSEQAKKSKVKKRKGN